MPTFGQPEAVALMSPVSGPGTHYAQLQPVMMDFSSGSIGSIIATSCLSGELLDLQCPIYPGLGGAYYNHASFGSDGSPHSPESVYEGTLHGPQGREDLSDIQEIILEQPVTGSDDGPRGGEDNGDEDDDDKSVMLDFYNLDFLDQSSCGSGSESSESHRRSEYPTVIYADDSGYLPQQLSHIKSSPHPHTPAPTATAATSHSQYHHHHHHHHHNNHHHHQQHHQQLHSLSSSPSTTTSSSSSNIWVLHDSPNAVLRCHDDRSVIFPPTPSQSPLPHSRVQTQQHHQQQQQQQHISSANLQKASMTIKEEYDDDDDAEYKPYCDSRRGAKKNLLWKFLLWVLDNRSDLAQWLNIERGEFKFVDTARVSDFWGQRKHKRDMTFEKLSRGIRHYYRRGLMERLPNTRLVYKFNWEKVPRRYRKA